MGHGPVVTAGTEVVGFLVVVDTLGLVVTVVELVGAADAVTGSELASAEDGAEDDAGGVEGRVNPEASGRLVDGAGVAVVDADVQPVSSRADPTIAATNFVLLNCLNPFCFGFRSSRRA